MKILDKIKFYLYYYLLMGILQAALDNALETEKDFKMFERETRKVLRILQGEEKKKE